MKRNPEKGVLLHTCHDRKTEIRTYKHLNHERFYYTSDDKFDSFKAVPLKCECKRYLSDLKAWELVIAGDALPVYKPKEGQLLHAINDVDDAQIVMVVDRPQTPRVDLITKADMERAYTPTVLKAVVEAVQTGNKSVFDKHKVSISVDSSDFVDHIEAVHDMIMEARAALIVPFQPDPLDGRILFPFGPDQRT